MSVDFRNIINASPGPPSVSSSDLSRHSSLEVSGLRIGDRKGPSSSASSGVRWADAVDDEDDLAQLIGAWENDYTPTSSQSSYTTTPTSSVAGEEPIGGGNPTSEHEKAMIHEAQLCRPCVFTSSGAECVSAESCLFCHFDHSKRSQKRPSKKKRDRLRQVIERGSSDPGNASQSYASEASDGPDGEGKPGTKLSL